MKRRKISKKYSKRLFHNTGANTKRINVGSYLPRGGISL